MRIKLAWILALAGLVTSPAFASVRSQADTLMPAATRIPDPYQRGLAEGWLEVAVHQDNQVLVSGTYNDAAWKALNNARHFIDASVPLTPIYGEKHWPVRPNWIAALREIEAVNERGSNSACKLESAGRLQVLTDEIWKEQEETHGTRWVHGWARIEQAQHLAEQVDAELAACPLHADTVAETVKSPTKTTTVRVSTDVAFAFDSAQLEPRGQEAISGLARSIASGGNVEVITVTGYTDRLGSARYNLGLSRQRARAVADALQAAGVKAGHFDVRGAGASSPVVICEGAESEAVIACLAPNRRVEVRVQSDDVQAPAGHDE